jgi:hypothetical protein
VPPDVTVDDEELVVGADDEDDEPDDVPVVPSVVVVSEPDAPGDLSVVALAPDEEEVEPDVALAPAAPAPGWSWETTIPMTTVAPVAATIAPLVTARSRALPLSLSVCPLGWAGAGMWSVPPFGNSSIRTSAFRRARRTRCGPAVTL